MSVFPTRPAFGEEIKSRIFQEKRFININKDSSLFFCIISKYAYKIITFCYNRLQKADETGSDTEEKEYDHGKKMQ